MGEINNRPPDFLMIDWQFIKFENFTAVDLLNDKPARIGDYWFYVHERTGELGYAICDYNGRKLCIVWQKKVYLKGRERLLNYVAFKENDKWIIRRAQSILITSLLLRNIKKKLVGLKFFYDLVTGDEKGEFYVNFK